MFNYLVASNSENRSWKLPTFHIWNFQPIVFVSRSDIFTVISRWHMQNISQNYINFITEWADDNTNWLHSKSFTMQVRMFMCFQMQLDYCNDSNDFPSPFFLFFFFFTWSAKNEHIMWCCICPSVCFTSVIMQWILMKYDTEDLN